MIETVQCGECGWHYAPTLGRHQCEHTAHKRAILGAKRYLESLPETNDLLDAVMLLSGAHLTIIRLENETC